MLDDISQPMSLPQLPALTLLPKLHDPFLSHKLPSPISFERPHEVDALVKRCEASLRRLSTLTHSFQPLGNMSTVTLVPNLTDNRFDDIKKTSAIVTVTELQEESREPSRNTQTSLRKTKAQSIDTRNKKWKVSKPTRPVPSRANSGLSRKSGSAMGQASEDNRSKCSCDTSMTKSKTSAATSFCDVAMGDPMSPKRVVSQLNDCIPSTQPDDSNICSLLSTAIITSNEVLLHSCINHLRNSAATNPLITIKASAPFAGERPNVPPIVAAQLRPILHEAVRTLLDDYPDYDCGEPSQRWNDYLNSVPAQLQQLFAAEWCRYVRRIKSFHENSPWDDFDYDHTQSCPHKDGCEMYTRIQVREAWNRFWKESILAGNRCVPKPSQVAQFLCNYGSDITPPKHANQPNINCVAGFREELVQTLECLGGDNARYNWKWLGDSLFKQRK
ncbi:hypothetical protein TWF569_001421 [Orbilia oligospora]|uniref:Uncharacterized protein n=2 Tax=Orbilia oligospora TaxID=2813651 RepID=A0A7C8J281_ORBOL|nr:hypothetical protein TWF102_000548 [Orbilia oligospora]KAF3117464.1 hypothetical protein TWF103_006203 [Orbilia oligospora]KAF3146948.1 hypothetical protein TWF594_003002 [Orbilia oligospora]KAF3153820.1 hypothetical protein TWF569_001421 [Orbilia oligospora]